MNVKYVLIRSAGQKADGTMTEATERCCQIALEKYLKGEVMTIVITTGAETAHRMLADEMEDFLRQAGIPGTDIVSLPTEQTPEEELQRAQAWAQNVGCIEELEQIFYNPHAAAVVTA